MSEGLKMTEYIPIHEKNLRPEYEHYRYMMFMLPIAMRARIIVETGLSRGFSTQLFCEAAKLIGGRVFTYDIEDSPETRKKIKELGLSEVWTFRMSDSVQGGRQWIYGKIDLLFLDSDHSSQHVEAELGMWTRHMSPLGIILIHDTFNSDPSKRPDTALLGALRFVSEHKEWKIMNLIEPIGMAVLWRPTH